MALFCIQMATILWDLEQLHVGRFFALHTRTNQGMCLQNIIGISVTMRALEMGQRFEHTFWIILLLLRWWQLQRYQKLIGPTLHVGPNDNFLVKVRLNAPFTLNFNSFF